MAVSQLLIIFVHKHAPVGRIALFNYTVVIFSGLIGWVVWNNTPGLLSLVEVLQVTAGGVLSTKFGGPNFQGPLRLAGLLEPFAVLQRKPHERIDGIRQNPVHPRLADDPMTGHNGSSIGNVAQHWHAALDLESGFALCNPLES